MLKSKVFFVLVVSAMLLSIAESKDRFEEYCSIIKSGYRFSLKIYKDFVSNRAQNIIFSPYSISSITAMLMLGSRGGTEQELRNFLQFGLCNPNNTLIHISHMNVRNLVRFPTDDVVINIADRIFADRSVSLKQEFVQASSKYYESSAQTVDFSRQPEQSRSIINAFVERETNGMLKDIMPDGSITSLTRIALVNAIYFKATWQTQFDPKRTTTEIFKSNGNTPVVTEFMNNRGMYKFETNSVFSIIELPYNGKEASMFIILPNEDDGLPHLERSIYDGNILQGLMQYGKTQMVTLKIPKFKLEFERDLRKTYQDLGVSSLFTKPDLSKMTDNNDIFISTIRHKAYIEVNEEGTEAAAATGIAGTRSLIFGDRFICDHPFMFFIVHNKTKSILFLGRYVSPA